jgi:hypothetical protein
VRAVRDDSRTSENEHYRTQTLNDDARTFDILMIA